MLDRVPLDIIGRGGGQLDRQHLEIALYFLVNVLASEVYIGVSGRRTNAHSNHFQVRALVRYKHNNNAENRFRL